MHTTSTSNLVAVYIFPGFSGDRRADLVPLGRLLHIGRGALLSIRHEGREHRKSDTAIWLLRRSGGPDIGLMMDEDVVTNRVDGVKDLVLCSD
jgi:hypothetical protein